MHQPTRRIVLALTSLTAALGLVACAPEDGALAAETGYDEPFGEVPDELKFDGDDAVGPRVAAGAATEVWAVRNQGSVRVTTGARRAGIAWGASSGLDWEQKFDRWVASFEVVPRASSGRTFRITTPYGARAFDAPTLECAEVALFLRATFASWYGLPFFVTGWDASTRQAMYAGHFGFVTRDGASLGRFPSFRTAYADHTSRWREGAAWPSDARLRGMRLGNDDAIAFLSTGGVEVGAGAYFDEMFLNKRVGYFVRLLLVYFGSANIADGANSFHVVPEQVGAGDILLHRWQRRGIGHVMPIMRRTDAGAGRFELEIASGSMPRRQPVWEDASYARGRFTSNYAGGVGDASDGNPYARLGGGVRRWRTAVLSGGRWRNIVPSADRGAYVPDSAVDAIAARPARFAELLAQVTPEERREVALSQVAMAREHLRRYPASCAARERREDAFDALYSVMDEYFGEGRAAVDARYRTREDGVYREMDYSRSRVCCWNSTTAAMNEIVLAYAEHEANQAAARGECVAPTVFGAEAADLAAGGDGFGRWRAYAASIGRAGEWRAWSEDESCAQRTLPGDVVSMRGAPAACTVGGSTPPSGDACDASGPDSAARPIALSGSASGRVCAGDEDFYAVSGTGSVTVSVRFRHSEGDLDVQVLDASGREIGASAGTSDEERVTVRAPFVVRVYGYSGAAAAYTITATR